MFRVTTTQSYAMPQPHAGWALVPGNNHFEGDMPEAVAARLSALQKQGAAQVHTLSSDGVATPWELPGTTRAVDAPAPVAPHPVPTEAAGVSVSAQVNDVAPRVGTVFAPPPPAPDTQPVPVATKR